MSSVIEDLEQDHRNMSKLLDLVELELEDLESGGEPDYELLLQILDYMVSYTHLFHHPKEDLIYRKLCERSPSAASTVEIMVQEHGHLEEQTKQFSELLETVTAGQIVRRDHVRQLAHAYLDANRQHMQREEQEVFPLFKKHLRKRDWAAVEADLPAADDPLFGEAVQEPYRALYERIMSGP